MAADEPIPDERLRLIFVCCHPALTPDARAALTLSTIGGLSTARIARAFLVTESTLAQRLVRAKRKIREAGIPFHIPGRAAWPERLEAVLATLEIAYAQAYADSVLDSDAAAFGLDVVRLSGLLSELLPQEPEVLAFAAMVRLAEGRRRARLDEHGAMLPLDEQDTALWDETMLSQGERLLAASGRMDGVGPYHLMAAIHAAHAGRRRTGKTPWRTILELYDLLARFRSSPVTTVNRAVPVGQVHGPDAGCATLEAAAKNRSMDAWLPYQAARAALSAAAGRREDALAAYAAALALNPARAERLFLERRAGALRNGPAPPPLGGSADRP